MPERFYTHIGQSGSAEPIALSREDRARHIALFGATGVGKSTLILNIIEQDIARGDGILLLDPHGDLAERALSLIPQHRSNQVCYFNFADPTHAVGFNVLDDVEPAARALLIDGVISAWRSIWPDNWGPRLEQILRHSAAALLEMPNASLVLMPRLLTDDGFRARVMARVSNPLTRSFFDRRFDAWRDTFREEAIDPVLNKVDAFLFSDAIRNSIGQARSTLHLDHAMERGRIVICNLAKGVIGETPAYLMGALILARVQAAAMGRATLSPSLRRPFHVLIDEAQNFGTGVVAQLLSEARKYSVNVLIATQYLAGLPDHVRASVLGNVGTLVVFRVGAEDAVVLAPEFHRLHQTFNPVALQQLEIGSAIVRSPTTEAVLATLPDAPSAIGQTEVIKKQSRRHYALPRKRVEANIQKVLAGTSGKAAGARL